MSRCIGCGAVLQNEFKEKPGYTPKLENDYCMRCFRLTHYHDLQESDVSKDNTKLISIINDKKEMVFFLTDLWNLNEEVMSLYHAIHTKKALLLTKWDTVPKYLNSNEVMDYIATYYNVKEPMTTVSMRDKQNAQVVLKYMKSKHIDKAYLLGFTNVGKSTFLNYMSHKNQITVSHMPNTTLDFINVGVEGVTLTDAPGFTYKSDYQESDALRITRSIPNEEVKPRTYQLKKDTLFLVDEITFETIGETNCTFYISNEMPIVRKYIPITKEYQIIDVPGNSDLVIKSVGFIRFSKPCQIKIDQEFSNLCEVRPSILGGIYE